MLDQDGIETGIALTKLVETGRLLGEILNVDLPAHLQNVQPVGVCIRSTMPTEQWDRGQL